jgi:hypothetical protein
VGPRSGLNNMEMRKIFPLPGLELRPLGHPAIPTPRKSPLDVLYLKRLVADFPPRRPVFDTESGHLGFVVDKAALGQVFSENFRFPCQISFH